MAVNTAAALRKLQSGQTLTAEEKAALGIGPAVSTSSTTKSTVSQVNLPPEDTVDTPTPTKNINNMTQEEIDAATKAVIAAGGKSTDKANRLSGETAIQANARITAGYKELTAKPIMTPEQIAGGGEVRWVRTGAGGVGAWKIVMPIGSPLVGSKGSGMTNGVIPGSGSTSNNGTGNTDYTTVNGILMYKGQPFTGSYNGKNYKDGKVVTTPSGDSDYKTVDGVLMYKGAPFTGIYNGKNYQDGKVVEGTENTSDYTTVDGILMYKGAPYTGPYNGKNYQDGKVVEGTPDGDYVVVNSVLYFKGVPFTGEYNGQNYKSGKTVDPEGNPLLTEEKAVTLVSTEIDEYGNTVGWYSDGSHKILISSGRKYKTTVDEDAYAILEKTFADYGLDDPDILKAIQGYMDRGLGSEQAGLELRKTTAYTTRFKGNEIRRAANLNVLSEAEYLALENSYNETLRAYGLQGYFGTDRKVSTAAMADIIGNDISAVEFKDRIDTVVTRVNNSDPNIKDTLRKFYNITDADLVKYFLNPKEALPILKQKVTSAEIGSEFIKQGLLTGVESATEYAKLGIDKATAAKGTETIAAILPETTKLSQIYAEEGINYSQLTAEEEVLKNLDSARRKRLKLAEREIGSFSGAAGLSQGALRSQTRGQI